jgi:signal transduction histidine kinase
MYPTNDIAICAWEETRFLFFSNNIWGDFIYYSHLLPALATILLTLFLFLNAPRSKATQALFFTGGAFTAWAMMDLFLWASDSIEHIMFVWSSLIYVELLIYVGALYFIYAYTTNKFPPLKVDLLIFILFIPLFLFGHTKLNLVAFDLTNCWREAIEGPLWQNYIYYVEAGIAIWILIFAIYQAYNSKITRRGSEVLLITIGTLSFLFMFSLGNIFGSLETDWELGQIGLFGMPLFLIFVSYVVIRYEALRAKVFAAEAIFSAAFILLLSILFVRTIENAHIIALSTLALFTVLGLYLVRNIKREIHQREEIEQLAKKLEQANGRLRKLDRQKSEFVSIASHQLRSPLTSIAGYASLLREGNYGNIPQKMLEPLDRIEQSARFMAEAVEDFLNVSRIESGNMKYKLTDFNLRDEAEHIADDIRPEALRQGLVLLFRTSMHGKGVVHADLGKVQQILHNLINNALKYTPKGTINVVVRDDMKNKRVYVDIVDTGIGMSTETLHSIFQKFGRGDKANSVNVKGTGLGLYVALKMAEAMGGTVTAHSEGEGKGSRFTVELPLVM